MLAPLAAVSLVAGPPPPPTAPVPGPDPGSAPWSQPVPAPAPVVCRFGDGGGRAPSPNRDVAMAAFLQRARPDLPLGPDLLSDLPRPFVPSGLAAPPTATSISQEVPTLDDRALRERLPLVMARKRRGKRQHTNGRPVSRFATPSPGNPSRSQDRGRDLIRHSPMPPPKQQQPPQGLVAESRPLLLPPDLALPSMPGPVTAERGPAAYDDDDDELVVGLRCRPLQQVRRAVSSPSSSSSAGSGSATPPAAPAIEVPGPAGNPAPAPATPVCPASCGALPPAAGPLPVAGPAPATTSCIPPAPPAEELAPSPGAAPMAPLASLRPAPRPGSFLIPNGSCQSLDTTSSGR